VLKNTKLNKNINFPIFVEAIKLIFDMLGECDVNLSDLQKLRHMETMIKLGDCHEYEQVISTRKLFKEYDYESIIEVLTDQYKI
jgi:hypothetical protein